MTALRVRLDPPLGFAYLWAGLASFGAGFALTRVQPTSSEVVLAVALVVAVPLTVAAVARIAQMTALRASLLVGLGGLYAVVIHHSPDISLLEVALLGPSLVLTAGEFPKLMLSAAGSGLIRIAILSACGLLALGALYAVRPPAGLDSGAPAKELIKNLEIFVIAAGTFSYIGTFRRLLKVYGFILVVALVSIAQTLAAVRGHVLSRTSLQTSAPLLVFALAVPFLRSRSVAALAVVSFGLVVVSRTRGAWLGLLLIAVVVVLSRAVRRALGRRGRTIAILAAVAMVVLIASSPRLLSRAASAASGNDQSVHDRLAMGRAALDELLGHPLTGVGPGEFKPWLLSSPPVVTFRIGVTAIPKDPHDAFAKFGAEMGWPGLLLFSGWATGTLAAAWRFRRALLGVPRLRPYGVGMSFLALLLGADLLTSEWATVGRLQIAIGAGALLALARLVPSELAYAVGTVDDVAGPHPRSPYASG